MREGQSAVLVQALIGVWLLRETLENEGRRGRASRTASQGQLRDLFEADAEMK